jgi:hypothetical protein
MGFDQERTVHHFLLYEDGGAIGKDPGLPMESAALHAIFEHYDTIRTAVETTATGVIVTQTSSDPKAVAALQQHASEVTIFVKDGMAAMLAAMMKNGSGMMPHGMHGWHDGEDAARRFVTRPPVRAAAH